MPATTVLTVSFALLMATAACATDDVSPPPPGGGDQSDQSGPRRSDPECTPGMARAWCDGDVVKACAVDGNYTAHSEEDCQVALGSGGFCSDGACACTANTHWCQVADGKPGITTCGADGKVFVWRVCGDWREPTDEVAIMCRDLCKL
jgi:hypothetical protein